MDENNGYFWQVVALRNKTFRWCNNTTTVHSNKIMAVAKLSRVSLSRWFVSSFGINTWGVFGLNGESHLLSHAERSDQLQGQRAWAYLTPDLPFVFGFSTSFYMLLVCGQLSNWDRAKKYGKRYCHISNTMQCSSRQLAPDFPVAPCK